LTLNTDKWNSGGKHWVGIFCDMRGKGKWTVEYFNCSGNAAEGSFIELINKLKNTLELLNPLTEVINQKEETLQYGETECGMFTLFYFYNRLSGIPRKNIKYGSVKKNGDDYLIDSFRR